MKAASATTTAISQGLYLGRQTSWSIVRAAELIGGIRPARRSCRAEADDHVLARIENDLHRNPLHDFHVVAGGILRRKQTEERAGCPGDAIYVAP
jgi:hypothetical protein